MRIGIFTEYYPIRNELLIYLRNSQIFIMPPPLPINAVGIAPFFKPRILRHLMPPSTLFYRWARLSHTAPFSPVTRPDPNYSGSTARAPGPGMADGGSARLARAPTGWILFFKTMGTGARSCYGTQRSDLFSVYRTYFSELLNETLTIKSASAGASF